MSGGDLKLSASEKKRKRSFEIIKKVFVKEDIMVDGMHRNLVPPPGVVGSRGLVIKEPKSGIFYYNRNFDLVFQREKEFHLVTTAQLIRIQSTIKRDTPEGKEMYKKKEFVIEARNEGALRLEKFEQHQTDSSQRYRQGSRRLLEDILVCWDGYQLVCRWKTLMFEESQGWQYPEDLLPFEEEQVELVLLLFMVQGGIIQ
ncbi:hypothetical protein Tco_0839995 [Tanacetum coccineum]|uniref:Uncharacterized protein n=1 Tax=Tanacetum coccineum TaxID=301880 RepID=A0ABQ5AW19_9ASTR